MKSSGHDTPLVPCGLADLQRDFGKAISQPFLFDGGGSGDYRLAQESYPKGIVDVMQDQPERNHSGADRLGTYNRQYWFRLLTIMQKEYALTCSLMGLLPFNQLVMAYLDACPSSSAHLRDLSNRFPDFLQRQGKQHLPAVHQAVSLEFRMIQAFDAAHREPLNPQTMDEHSRESLTANPLSFQPHWFLFQEDWNLVHWRSQVMASAEPETMNIALKQERAYWAIYRLGKVRTEVLGPLQYRLLGPLKQGAGIEEALTQMSEELNESQFAFLKRNIGPWFAHWMSLGWFTER